MNEFEQEIRRKAIAENGIDNNPYKTMNLKVITGKWVVVLRFLATVAFTIGSFLFLYEMVSRL